ncbi:hypothetical protein ACFUIY_03035 [Streptomyces griseorubiginosus]|uniref:hypothetical protein n=1 Tax=Streptomyces griseorubiginosus TaxID=67304 RepID=UPI003637D7D6
MNDTEHDGPPGEAEMRIPLALVALVLYSGALVRFLTGFLSGFSVGKLMEGLVGLAFETGMTTALVLAVVLFRRRRQRGAGQG